MGAGRRDIRCSYPGGLRGSAQAVDRKKATTTGRRPCRSRISLIVAREAGESRRSKGGDGLRKRSTSIELRVRRQPDRGRERRALGRIRAARAFCCKKRSARRRRTRRRRGRHRSAARRGGVRSQLGSGAAERGAQQGSARSGRADGRRGGGASARADRTICAVSCCGNAIDRAKSAGSGFRSPEAGNAGLAFQMWWTGSVQQAVLQVLEPIFEPTFHPSSHGFRPERGAHTAIAEVKGHLQAGCRTVVDLDLAKFFDRVHHQRLLDRLGRKVKDQRVVDLVRLMLKAAVVMPDGTKIAVQEGTPQGGPLSPMLSNIVLDELDRELARRGLRFVALRRRLQYLRAAANVPGERVMASISAISGAAHAAPGQRGEEWRAQRLARCIFWASAFAAQGDRRQHRSRFLRRKRRNG